jgi:membrane associated rhomboid family serine protease
VQSPTAIIAGVTALVWLVIAATGATQRAAETMGFVPVRFAGTVMWPSNVPAWFTPLSSTLVHGGLLHLAFNLLMLVWCGFAVERVLGRTSLVVLYVIGAFTAAGAQWLVAPESLIPVIGASGAISAVIGAFALSFGRPRGIVNSPRLNRWLNAIWLLAAWIVLQLMVGFLAGGQGMLLATPAHVGGFLAGLCLQRPLLLWRYRYA